VDAEYSGQSALPCDPPALANARNNYERYTMLAKDAEVVDAQKRKPGRNS
jgi:hypothetical protein